jgi:hypothetical protein
VNDNEKYLLSGSEWDCGFGYGANGFGWLKSINSIRMGLGRHLDARERALFAYGWRAGVAELAAYKADMERQDDDAMRAAINLAIPF